MAYYFANEYFEDGVTENNRPVLYNDYECPYHGNNTDDMLRKEEKEYRHRERLIKEHETDPLTDMGIGGM